MLKAIKAWKRSDLILISALSIILTGIMFISLTGAFNDKFVYFGDTGMYGNANVLEPILSSIIRFPYLINFFVLNFFMNTLTGNTEYLGPGIWGVLLSPITGLIFWFILFAGLRKIIPTSQKNNGLFARNCIPVTIFLFLICGFIYYVFLK